MHEALTRIDNTQNKGRHLALVTGAGGGIGSATVERLIADGMRVIGVDVNVEKLKPLCRRFDVENFISCPFDLSHTDQIADLVAQLTKENGPITRLVNNAAIWNESSIFETDQTTWDRTLGINLTASFLMIREMARVTAAAGGGAVVNVVSRNAFRSSVNNAAYDASKGALLSLTRTAAGELARYNIRVNALCPGVIATPPNQSLVEDSVFHRAYCKLIPLDRFGTPAEMASVISFLLSDDASFITGQSIVADGGQLACQDNERFMELHDWQEFTFAEQRDGQGGISPAHVTFESIG